ncbi:MAG: hypothetical protein ACR2IE_09885 [Candidatus Sumerlaeaceae bacterium]
MDFRPTRNTLVANYVVTFGVVGLIIFLSTRPGNVVKYYYSPEYSSHSSYGTSNCATCHSSPWSNVTDKNCSTAGCHTAFEPGKGANPERLAQTKDEFGNARPRFGAILAFHDKVMGQTSCEVCHPSHRLPQKGLFNHETILVAMQQAGGVPTNPQELAKKRADVFHRGAERFAGKMSCQECHVGMSSTGSPLGAAAAGALQEIGAAGQAETVSGAAPAAEPRAAGATSSTIATGDLLNLPPMGGQTQSSAGSETVPSALPNLFEAAHQATQPAATPQSDSSVQMPD